MPFSSSGQIGLLPRRQQLALSGFYWVVNNVPGTSVTGLVATGFSATANGMFVVRNTNSVASGKQIFLDRLTFFQNNATVPIGTSLHFEVYNETGLVVGTGNVATRTPQNVGTASYATGAIVQGFSAGGITIPAAVGTRKLVALGKLPVGVNVVSDTCVVDFGGDGVASGRLGLTAARATDTARNCTQMAAVCIPPQTTSWLNTWGQGTNAPDYEYELSYVEIVGT